VTLLEPFEQLLEPPTFIVGHARSGTTWVYDIFTAHPLVAGVYESWLFTAEGFGSFFRPPHTYDSPGRPQGVAALMEPEELLGDVKQMVQHWMGRAVRPGQQFLVEKSPSHVHWVDLVERLFPDCRYINVVRDGRDVAVSVRAAAASWAPDWRRDGSNLVLRTALTWQEATRAGDDLAAKAPGRVLKVHYEKLKSNPRAEISRIFDFCRIPLDESRLSELIDKTDFKKNFVGGEDQFRRGGRVGDWHRQLSRSDLLMFFAGARRGLIEQGYERGYLWIGDALRRAGSA
jgi:hypothetical protein